MYLSSTPYQYILYISVKYMKCIKQSDRERERERKKKNRVLYMFCNFDVN